MFWRREKYGEYSCVTCGRRLGTQRQDMRAKVRRERYLDRQKLSGMGGGLGLGLGGGENLEGFCDFVARAKLGVDRVLCEAQSGEVTLRPEPFCHWTGCKPASHTSCRCRNLASGPAARLSGRRPASNLEFHQDCRCWSACGRQRLSKSCFFELRGSMRPTTASLQGLGDAVSLQSAESGRSRCDCRCKDWTAAGTDGGEASCVRVALSNDSATLLLCFGLDCSRTKTCGSKLKFEHDAEPRAQDSSRVVFGCWEDLCQSQTSTWKFWPEEACCWSGVRLVQVGWSFELQPLPPASSKPSPMSRSIIQKAWM